MYSGQDHPLTASRYRTVHGVARRSCGVVWSRVEFVIYCVHHRDLRRYAGFPLQEIHKSLQSRPTSGPPESQPGGTDPPQPATSFAVCTPVK